MIILLVIINFAISWLNAWSVGRNWAEAKHAGGWAYFLNWCGAIMSACGFTWCYTIIGVEIAQGAGYLNAVYAEGALRLGYLIVILPIIGSGLGITVESWSHFYRKRSFANGAAAGWNTFAQVYNLVTAFDAVPESLSFVAHLFKTGDDDDDDTSSFMLRLMILIAVLALIGGVLTTAVIARLTARRTATSRSWGMQIALEEERAKRATR